MEPALSVGQISLTGDGSVLSGTDRYVTSLAQEANVPDSAPIAFVRVGRSLQPIGLAGFHVQPDPNE